MRRFIFHLAAACVFAAASLRVYGDEDPVTKSERTQGPDSNIIESFEVEGNGDLLLIPVTVGGRDYSFVVDTGSSLSTFDVSLRESLIPTSRTESINGNSSVEVFECRGATVGTGRLPLGKQALCSDLGRLRAASGVEFQGVLGMNFIRNYVIQLNFDAGRLQILKSSEGVAGVSIPMTIGRTGTPTVDVDVPPIRVKVPFLIDTAHCGFDSGDLRPSIFKFMAERNGVAGVGRTPDVGFDEAQATPRSVVLDRVLLAGFEHKGELFTDGRKDILGLWYLSRYNITFDFPRKRMYLEKGMNFGRACTFNESGVFLEKRDGDLIVGDVSPDGIGFASGVRKGDRLLKINGKDAGHVQLFAARLLLRGLDQELQLQLLGDGDDNPREVRIRRLTGRVTAGESERHAPK